MASLSLQVQRVTRGLDAEVASLWSEVLRKGLDAALVVTADHGHITVPPGSMVQLPQDALDCLEYANLGVHGKGRHAVFHCRSGREDEFEAAWRRDPRLCASFILLRVADAIGLGLFGPDDPLPRVRPRLGDYISLSLNADTLSSPAECRKYRHRVQGAHGSLTREEMRIPFVLVST